MSKIIFALISIIIIGICNNVSAQNLEGIEIQTKPELSIKTIKLSGAGKFRLSRGSQLFSFEVNKKVKYSSDFESEETDGSIIFGDKKIIRGKITEVKNFNSGVKYILSMENASVDTISISNFVPLGRSPEMIYITAFGPNSLARTKLFRPGMGAVGVILPDNAWESGYASFEINDSISICALSRRSAITNGKKTRWKTVLYPGGRMEYFLYFDVYSGIWQNGLKLMFRERYLYDLENFDNTLYEREDLQWIKDKYLITLQFAWDHNFFDIENNQYNIFEFLEEGKTFFGGYDILGIWATWPTLGLDQRNQWDLYRDLPGGLDKIREISVEMQKDGTRLFIAYNPWDKSTRDENPYEGLANLIRATDASGVVLDTRGSSDAKLQAAADSVKPGVVMYSEGMAVPKNMPGIIAGRVHDAIYLPPPLNLNKYIKPEHSIFRVCQLNQGRLHREIAVSLFNGIGIELNTFGPGRPDWMEEDFPYLGKAVRILRENSSAFKSNNWLPLLPAFRDSVWVNKFPTESKTIYTVFSLLPQGFDAPLFPVDRSNGHFVSLWNHNELKLSNIKGGRFVPVNVNSFNRSQLGTRLEGNVDVVAEFQKLLTVNFDNDTLRFSASAGDEIKIWNGAPSYQKQPMRFDNSPHALSVYSTFGRYEGKIVIQLFSGSEIIDERVVRIEPGVPRKISRVIRTEPAEAAPSGMVEIPFGNFLFSVRKHNSFIPYPDYSKPEEIQVRKFYIDKYPVTNEQFYNFLSETGYLPTDTTNFLKHWKKGKYPTGEGNFPVVYISYEDALAYSEWLGKRLPTEVEWQYAAQTSNLNKYPWGNEFDSTKCNNASGNPTHVNAFPSGANPFGIEDLIGNVWQLTNDIYDDGSYYFIILKGGSYYKPTSSWWYVQGGAQPLDYNQMLLRVSPGFERNATVGFRCVKDAITKK